MANKGFLPHHCDSLDHLQKPYLITLVLYHHLIEFQNQYHTLMKSSAGPFLCNPPNITPPHLFIWMGFQDRPSGGACVEPTKKSLGIPLMISKARLIKGFSILGGLPAPFVQRLGLSNDYTPVRCGLFLDRMFGSISVGRILWFVFALIDQSPPPQKGFTFPKWRECMCARLRSRLILKVGQNGLKNGKNGQKWSKMANKDGNQKWQQKTKKKAKNGYFPYLWAFFCWLCPPPPSWRQTLAVLATPSQGQSSVVIGQGGGVS